MNLSESTKDRMIKCLQQENLSLETVVKKQDEIIELLRQENKVLHEYTDNLQEMIDRIRKGEA